MFFGGKIEIKTGKNKMKLKLQKKTTAPKPKFKLKESFLEGFLQIPAALGREGNFGPEQNPSSQGLPQEHGKEKPQKPKIPKIPKCTCSTVRDWGVMGLSQIWGKKIDVWHGSEEMSSKLAGWEKMI